MTRTPSKKKVEMEERRKVVAANILSGLNYRDIAEALNVSIGTVASDMKIILGRLQKEQVTVASEYVTLELRRIDRAMNAIWTKVQDGNLDAIETMIKLQTQRARFTGTFSPDKLELSGPGGAPIETRNIDQVREERWKKVEGDLARVLQQQEGEMVDEENQQAPKVL